MNVIDIVILVILAVAFIYGCVKGLIKSIGAVVGAVVGFVAAKMLSATVQPWLTDLLPKAEAGTLRVVSYIVLFILAWVLCALIFRLIEKLFNAMMLGWVNRLLGGALSTVLTVAVISLLLNVYNYLDKSHTLLGQENVAESTLYEPVRKALPTIFPSMDMEKWRKPELKMPELPDLKKDTPEQKKEARPESGNNQQMEV